jgi:hypothetical protein
MTTPATPSDAKKTEMPTLHEEHLTQFWARYGNTIYFICGVIAFGILAKGGWEYLNAQKELGIRKEYAQCVTTDSFRSFVANHPGHPLTGVAEITIADNSYTAGKYAEALGAYTSAIADLPSGPLQARARMGQAISLAFTGKAADAEASLRKLMNDTGLLKTFRCEAGYHLAVLDLDAGRGAEVQGIAEQLLRIDPTSPFAERAFSLRPVAPESGTVPSGPAVTVPARP